MKVPILIREPAGRSNNRRRRLLLGLFSIVLAGLLGLAVFQATEPSGSGQEHSAATSGPEDLPESAAIADSAREQRPASLPGDNENPRLNRRRDASTLVDAEAVWPWSSSFADPQSAGIRIRTSNSRGEPDEPDPPARSISGAVLDDSGSLLSGIRVSARPVGMPGAGNRTGNELIQVTDALGSFSFDRLEDNGEYQLAVAESTDHHGGYLRVRTGVDNAELRLQRKRQIHVYGLISDKSGHSLSGARVRTLGSGTTVIADTAGAYEIIADSLPGGQAPVLEFAHQDHRELRQRVETAMDLEVSEYRLDVELEPVGQKVDVVGQVIGPGGKMISGIRIWITSPKPGNYRRTISDQWGDFRFDGIEVGDSYRLGVDANANFKAYVSEPFQVGPYDTVHDVRLEGSEYADLSGRVLDPEGEPLGHFTLWLKTIDSGQNARVPITTDGSGYFQAEGIPAGPVQLETASQPRLQAGGVVLEPGESRYVEFPLDWGGEWMFGRVIDTRGDPVPQARITLQWSMHYSEVTSTSHRQAFSDIGGHFTMTNLGGFDYQVTVQAPGFRTKRFTQSPGSNEFEVVVQPAASIAAGHYP